MSKTNAEHEAPHSKGRTESITQNGLDVLMEQFKDIYISKSHFSGYKKTPATLEGFTEHCNIACVTKNGTRAKGDKPKEALNAMYFDYDGQEEAFKEIIKSLVASNQSFLAYPSPSFKDKLEQGEYRYRLVVPTSDGLTVDNYKYNALKFAREYGLSWNSESWDTATLKIKQVIYPPVMTSIKEPKDSKPKPRNMTAEDVNNHLSSRTGDVWQVQESFTAKEKSELDETLPKQRDPEGNIIPRGEIKEVLIEPETMLYLNGEELGTMEECRGKVMFSDEEVRCDCPFDDPENSVHSKIPHGYAYFDNKGMVHCRNAHENLRGVAELSNKKDGLSIINETGYDEIFLDIAKGKYVFSKGGLSIAHEPSKAVHVLELPSKDARKFLESVPRLYAEYNPTKENRYINRFDMETMNTFKPSKYVEASSEVVTELPKNVKILLEHLISHNETHRVFINALANHLQNGTSIHTGWIFKGIEGAGKGILMELIFKVFGEHNSQKSKLTNFTGDKVKGITEKLIGFVDESADYKIMGEVVENLKSIIGNTSYSSRALFSDATDVLNFTMHFFAVNSFGFKLSANDRRMNIIECPKLLSDVVTDLNKFHKELMGEAQALTDYLLNVEVDKKLITKIVHTEFRQQMITDNLPLAERLTKCIIDGNLKPIESGCDEDSDDYTNVEEQLEHIAGYQFIQGTVLVELAKQIFSLTGIEDQYFKKNNITKLLKDKWAYKGKKVDGTSVKCYDRGEGNGKTLTHEIYNTFGFD